MTIGQTDWRFLFCVANIVIFFDFLNRFTKIPAFILNFATYFSFRMNNKYSIFKRVPWVFFDLDDTLWNFSANSTFALHKLYEISPILRKLFKNTDEFIDIYHKHNSLLWLLYSRGEVSTNQLKTERWRRTLATRQFEVLTAVCEELDRNYLKILAECQIEVQGAKQLLINLSKKALISILSNGFSSTQYRKLRYSGLGNFINRTIVSEEIGINKPDVRIFNYAIEETGATAPYLMVGDNVETDIVGAMRAGWHAIWINHNNQSFPLTIEDMKIMGIDDKLLLGTVKNLEMAEPLIENFLINHA